MDRNCNFLTQSLSTAILVYTSRVARLCSGQKINLSPSKTNLTGTPLNPRCKRLREHEHAYTMAKQFQI